MTAALVVFAVFFGLSLVVATTAGAILLANGKLTLPGTNMRRIQHAKVELTLAQIALENESLNIRVDDAIHLRLERASSDHSREPGHSIILKED